MAQYVYDASKYPNGTLLSQLDWVSTASPVMDYIVTEIGATGRKFWKGTQSTTLASMTLSDTQSDYEILALLDATRIEQGSPAYHGIYIGFGQSVGSPSADTFFQTYAYVASNNSLSYVFTPGFGTKSSDVAPTGLSTTKAVGCRFRLGGGGASIQCRYWAANVGELEAAEPVTWGSVGDNGSNYVPKVIATPRNITTSISAFTSISIGTNGDSAPYPDPSVTLTVPSPSISNVTATTATANWT